MFTTYITQHRRPNTFIASFGQLINTCLDEYFYSANKQKCSTIKSSWRTQGVNDGTFDGRPSQKSFFTKIINCVSSVFDWRNLITTSSLGGMGNSIHSSSLHRFACRSHHVRSLIAVKLFTKYLTRSAAL